MMPARFGSLLLIVALAGPSTAAPAQEPGGFRGLPSLVCVDRRTSDFCRGARGEASMTKEAAWRAAQPEVVDMPMIACELPDADGPCATLACGDKVCAFGEQGTCALDCPMPAQVDVCRCEGVRCTGVRVRCDTAGCKTEPAAPDEAFCKCAAPDGAQVCAAEAGRTCQTMRFSQPLVACELVRFSVSKKHRATGRCTHVSCAPTAFGLVDADDLPPVDKVAVDAVK